MPAYCSASAWCVLVLACVWLQAPGEVGPPPVVRLSGIGPVDENAVGTMADVELEFAHDSDWSDLGDGDDGEDPDSNSEGYYGNDYPEVKAWPDCCGGNGRFASFCFREEHAVPRFLRNVNASVHGRSGAGYMFLTGIVTMLWRW